MFLIGSKAPRDLQRAAKWMAQAANDKHEIAALWLSELYAKGLGMARDPQRAAQLLERALATAGVAAKNEFAWQLAVVDDALLRNGALAVKIMEAALADPQARKPAYLDTLAAAYADVGDFKAAVAMQLQALDAIKESVPASHRDSRMEARVADYRTGKAFR